MACCKDVMACKDVGVFDEEEERSSCLRVPHDLYSDGTPFGIPPDVNVNLYRLEKRDPLSQEDSVIRDANDPRIKEVLWRPYTRSDVARGQYKFPPANLKDKRECLLRADIRKISVDLCNFFTRDDSVEIEYRLFPGSKPEGLICACKLPFDGKEHDWYRAFIITYGIEPPNKNIFNRSRTLLYLFDCDHYALAYSKDLRYLPNQLSESRGRPPTILQGWKKRDVPLPKYRAEAATDYDLSREVNDNPKDIEIEVKRSLFDVALECWRYDFNPTRPFTCLVVNVKSPTDFELMPPFMDLVKFPGPGNMLINCQQFDQLLSDEMNDPSSSEEFRIPLDWIDEWLYEQKNDYYSEFICAAKPRCLLADDQPKWYRVMLKRLLMENNPDLIEVEQIDSFHKERSTFVAHVAQLRMLPRRYLRKPIYRFKAGLAFLTPIDCPETQWKDPTWSSEPVLNRGVDLSVVSRNQTPPSNNPIDRMKELVVELRDQKRLIIVFGIKNFGTVDEKYMVEICNMEKAYGNSTNFMDEAEIKLAAKTKLLWISSILIGECLAQRPSFMLAKATFGQVKSTQINAEYAKKVAQQMRKFILHYQQKMAELKPVDEYKSTCISE